MDPDSSKKKEINIPKEKTLVKNKLNLPTILTGVIILLVIIVLVITKPAITGYVVADQFEETNMNVSEFLEEQELTKSELVITQTNLDTCKELNQDYLDDISEERSTSFQCDQEKNELQSKYNNLKSEYELEKQKIESDFKQKEIEIEIENQQLETKYNDVKTLHDSLVTNIANNICCKAKVDNKNIDSYLISNSMIVCATGAENKITC